MNQPLTQILILLLCMSVFCLKEGKRWGKGKTRVVKHDKKWWMIKTADVGAKEEGKDYQEDDLNREALCSFWVFL